MSILKNNLINLKMILIIGLGNPGQKYIKTRHNIGFRIIDKFAKENNFPEFKLVKKFNSLISENILNDKKIILAKPQTFMNNSGKAVKSLINFYKPTKFIIIHDDIDLPLKEIKTVKNRGSAGHKGVESIIKELGSKDFTRIRIGIRPTEKKPQNTERFVIQRFTSEEEKTIKEITKKALEIIENGD